MNDLKNDPIYKKEIKENIQRWKKFIDTTPEYAFSLLKSGINLTLTTKYTRRWQNIYKKAKKNGDPEPALYCYIGLKDEMSINPIVFYFMLNPIDNSHIYNRSLIAEVMFERCIIENTRSTTASLQIHTAKIPSKDLNVSSTNTINAIINWYLPSNSSWPGGYKLEAFLIPLLDVAEFNASDVSVMFGLKDMEYQGKSIALPHLFFFNITPRVINNGMESRVAVDDEPRTFADLTVPMPPFKPSDQVISDGNETFTVPSLPLLHHL